MSSAIRAVLAAALVSALSACATPKATQSGFLSDYETLAPQQESDGLVHSLSADPERIAAYEAVHIAPVEILADNLTDNQKDAVRTSLENALSEAFSRHWTLADGPEGRTMTVRSAVTDLHKSNVALNIVTTAILAPVDFGTLSVEGEVLDSQSREQLAALTWARSSGVRQTFQTFTPTGSGRALAPFFARDLVSTLGKDPGPIDEPQDDIDLDLEDDDDSDDG